MLSLFRLLLNGGFLVLFAIVWSVSGQLCFVGSVWGSLPFRLPLVLLCKGGWMGLQLDQTATLQFIFRFVLQFSAKLILGLLHQRKKTIKILSSSNLWLQDFNEEGWSHRITQAYTLKRSFQTQSRVKILSCFYEQGIDFFWLSWLTIKCV